MKLNEAQQPYVISSAIIQLLVNSCNNLDFYCDFALLELLIYFELISDALDW